MKSLSIRRGEVWDPGPGIQGPKGSILIVCFFALVLLTMFTITVGYTLRQKIQVLARLDARQKLRLIGEAGVQRAIYELLQCRQHSSSYDALSQSWSRNEPAFKEVEVGDGRFSVCYPAEPSGQQYGLSKEEIRYGLIDEERKININLIGSQEILRRFLKEAGSLLSDDEVAALVDAIRDWKDEDDDTSLSGAESYYYKGLKPAYAPRNGRLATLAELQWVKGMTPEIFAKIQSYITLESSGKVNVNTASKPVLMALGIPGHVSDRILTYRSGPDQIEGTDDDRFFEDLSSVIRSLAIQNYLDNNDRANLQAVIQSGLLTVKSQTFSAHVIARLKFKTQSFRVTAIFDEKGVVKRWEESFAAS